MHPTSVLAIPKILLLAAFLAAPQQAPAAPPNPAVPDAVSDRFVSNAYPQKALTGYLGARLQVDLEERLLKLNSQHILAPFVKRPGVQDWVGEHVGKFLHAGCHAWLSTGDARLKAKMDSVVTALLATQLPDGYLGTYLDQNRWTSWDVWSHKYNLIGLLTYHQTFGHEPSLAACKKMADLLLKTFGRGPGQKSLNASGTHVGMAPGSVLEPLVMLYRFTGEAKYLEFCRYILKEWDAPGGPAVVTSLAAGKTLQQTANNKAYEMLSCVVGVTDMYRMTGEAKLLLAAQNGWADLTAKRRYLTGTSSRGEHFTGDFDLNGEGNVGEGCVTVTWLQLNWHLLRLTGKQQYVEEIERTVYNALAGAQHPVNGKVCYFAPLIGTKPYGTVSHGLPGISCCSSSLPRGLQMIPLWNAGADSGKPVLFLYLPGEWTVPVRPAAGGPLDVKFVTESNYPLSGAVGVTLRMTREARFPLLLRVPAWCARFQATVSGQAFTGEAGSLVVLDRSWKDGDRVQIEMDLTLHHHAGGKSYPGKKAFQIGPQLLVTDDKLTSATLPAGWAGSQIWNLAARQAGVERKVILVPFADAGQTGGRYALWQDSALIPSVGLKKGRPEAPSNSRARASALSGSSRLFDAKARKSGRDRAAGIRFDKDGRGLQR